MPMPPENQATTRPMQAIALWPLAQRALVRGVMTDIDDTLTTDGIITKDAVDALADLKARGFSAIAITGRPAGWCEPFADTLPLDAIVAENGAVAFVASETQGAEKIYLQDAATRQRNFTAMQQVAQRIQREVPGATLATDSPGRECDIAIDHSEFTCLPPVAIAQVVAIMQAAGMNATVSSIHINGWFGSHNKWEGGRWIVQHLFGRALANELAQWAYIGDSTNDEQMFARFGNSIGVANIARFATHMRHLPRYVTQAERGTGFAEMARTLLSTDLP